MRWGGGWWNQTRGKTHLLDGTTRRQANRGLWPVQGSPEVSGSGLKSVEASVCKDFVESHGEKRSAQFLDSFC